MRALQTTRTGDVDNSLVAAPERLSTFLARLRRMSSGERIWASRYEFSLWELNVWTAHYPDEVPRMNGEFEWIAGTLADNE